MGDINKISVLGAGMMGAEIGLCFAAAGHQVVLKDTCLELANAGKSKLERVIDRAISKDRFAADQRDATLARITPSAEIDDLNDVDLVVEAIFEDFDVKRTTLEEVDQVCPASCIIASNTSSIPITKLATSVAESRRPRFIGTHFFAPAFTMKLVEVIPGIETSKNTIDTVTDLCHTIGKSPIEIKDTAGFVVNRLLFALFGEAVRLIDEGVASCEDIDTACQLGLGHPFGPFSLMDMASLGLALDIGTILQEAHGDRFRFGEALKQKVNAGHLGRKSGKGWHSYD